MSEIIQESCSHEYSLWGNVPINEEQMLICTKCQHKENIGKQDQLEYIFNCLVTRDDLQYYKFRKKVVQYFGEEKANKNDSLRSKMFSELDKDENRANHWGIVMTMLAGLMFNPNYVYK